MKLLKILNFLNIMDKPVIRNQLEAETINQQDRFIKKMGGATLKKAKEKMNFFYKKSELVNPMELMDQIQNAEHQRQRLTFLRNQEPIAINTLGIGITKRIGKPSLLRAGGNELLLSASVSFILLSLISIFHYVNINEISSLEELKTHLKEDIKKLKFPKIKLPRLRDIPKRISVSSLLIGTILLHLAAIIYLAREGILERDDIILDLEEHIVDYRKIIEELSSDLEKAILKEETFKMDTGIALLLYKTSAQVFEGLLKGIIEQNKYLEDSPGYQIILGKALTAHNKYKETLEEMMIEFPRVKDILEGNDSLAGTDMSFD